MKFCPKCGKQLADGEVCTCTNQGNPGTVQAQPQMNTQPVQPQMNGQMGTQPAQGGYAQPQMNGQFNGQPQMNMQAPSPIVKDLKELITGIFKSPVATITKYVNNASAATSCLLIGILALVAGLRELIYIAGHNVKYPTSTTYEGISVFTHFLNDVVVEIAVAAAFAAVILLLVNAFEKDHKITFTQALALASLIDLIYLPVAVVATVVNLVPVTFFSYIASWMKSFANGVNAIWLFLGIKALERDDNHMPIVYGASACAIAIVTTLVNLIF